MNAIGGAQAQIDFVLVGASHLNAGCISTGRTGARDEVAARA